MSFGAWSYREEDCLYPQILWVWQKPFSHKHLHTSVSPNVDFHINWIQAHKVHLHVSTYYSADISTVRVLNHTTRLRSRHSGETITRRLTLQENLRNQRVLLQVEGNVPDYDLNCNRWCILYYLPPTYHEEHLHTRWEKQNSKVSPCKEVNPFRTVLHCTGLELVLNPCSWMDINLYLPPSSVHVRGAVVKFSRYSQAWSLVVQIGEENALEDIKTVQPSFFVKIQLCCVSGVTA